MEFFLRIFQKILSSNQQDFGLYKSFQKIFVKFPPKVVTKTTSIQAGMLPSCTVPQMVSMAPMASYLLNTLKISKIKDSFFYTSREYLFV